MQPASQPFGQKRQWQRNVVVGASPTRDRKSVDPATDHRKRVQTEVDEAAAAAATDAAPPLLQRLQRSE